MPSAHIVVETKIEDSFRVASMSGIFDVDKKNKITHSWDVDIPIEKTKWNVGLIVGSSGGGKTTIAKKLFTGKLYEYHEGFKWHKTKSILDCFDSKKSVSEITNVLSHVGFSSPPSWLKPYHVLSNGEKFRVELARILIDKKKCVIVDEFTSVIDRNVAKIGSYAVSKTIKKNHKQIICVSCHRDILEWLEPDWVYDVDISKFYNGRYLQRPEIRLQLFRVNYKAWGLFKKHHYLDANINRSARCYVAFWDNIPVGFTSCLPLIHATLKNTSREHRTVILPDFQGVGIGNKVSIALGEILKKDGRDFYSTTSHPSYIHTRIKSKKWKLKRKPSYTSNDKKMNLKRATNRLTCSFKFVG